MARRLLSSGLLLLVLAGCARLLAPPRQRVLEDARRAVQRLANRWGEFSTLRTLAEFDLRRGDERQSFTGVLLVKAPASVRIEALSPFGQPLLLATIHDGRIVAYDVAANEAVMGPATADTTARLLRMPFEPEDLVGVLTGRPAPMRDLRIAELSPADADGPSLLLVGTVHQQRIWMDFDTGVVHQIEITGGLYEIRITYERGSDGEVRALTLSAPRARISGSVRYRNPVRDGGIEDDRFRMTVPDTAKIQHVR